MLALNPGNNVSSLYNECICECDLCGRQFRDLLDPVCFLNLGKMSQIIFKLNTTNELNKGGFSKV